MGRLRHSIAGALLATVLGLAGVLIPHPGRADASDCAVSGKDSATLGWPGTEYQPIRVIFGNRSACGVVWVEGNLTASGTYRFRVQIQDTVDPSTFFDAGIAQMQWSTPCAGGCTNPWTTKVSDTNSVDFTYNQNGVTWISPNLNVVTNGMPGQFKWRMVLTTASYPPVSDVVSSSWRVGPQ